jgi:AcrR family transcriptional regulator
MGRPNARGKIMDAATEVFCRKGYGEATTREISERAGIAEVTLFRNFCTKKDLYFEVLRPVRGQLSEVIESLKDKTGDDGAMLKNLLIDRLTMAEKNSRLFGLLLNDMQYHRDVKVEFAGIYRGLLDALTQYLSRNFIKSSRQEAAAAARYFIWLIMGSVINKNLLGDTEDQGPGSQGTSGDSTDGRPYDAQAAADQSERIIEIFLNGIKDRGTR